MKINESRTSSDDGDGAAATLQRNFAEELVKGMRSRLPTTVPSFSLIVECEFLRPSASGAATTLGLNGSTVSSPSSRGASPYLEEVFPCECRFSEAVKDPESQACGERSSCINRSLSIECNPEDCVCRDNCRNQRFQKHQYADVEVFETPGKGFGLCTRQNIEPGQFIFEYVGEVVTQRQFEERAELYAEQGQPHFYFMTLQNDQIIDATRKGNLARFMNHSCNPNCATQKWIVRGRLRIGLFALKRIKSGTELTFDYKFIRFGGEAQRCLCGEANCKGVIGEEQPAASMHNLAPTSSIQGGRPNKRQPQSTAQEEEDVEAARKKFTEATGLNDEEDLTLLARILLRTEERDAIIGLLGTLQNTTSNGLLMRRFVTLHGLQIISVLMGLYWRDAEIIGRCVSILDGLPIANRDFVEDAHVEEKLDRLASSRGDLDDSTRQQIGRILERWRGLEKIFRIPRASGAIKRGVLEGQEVPTSAAPSNVPATAAGYSLREGDFLVSGKGGGLSWPSFTGTSMEAEASNRHCALGGDRRPTAGAGNQEREMERRAPHHSGPLFGKPPITGKYHSDHDERRRRSQSPPRRKGSPTNKIPPGWHQAHDSNRRPYYYHEVTRETRWEPPPSIVTTKPVGKDESRKLGEIIERARKAAFSRDLPREAGKVPTRPPTMSPISPTLSVLSSPAPPELEARFRDAVAACVEKYLGKWCRSQIEPGSSRFKELCRKLTHGIVGKELRHLRERMTGVDVSEHGGETTSWLECDSKELPAGKRAKVKVFLLQYLKDHGYRIEE